MRRVLSTALALVVIDWLTEALQRRPRRHSYSVELGGQRFTQAEWEAVQTYIDGTDALAEPGCSSCDPDRLWHGGQAA